MKARWSKSHPSLRVQCLRPGDYSIERVCGARYVLEDERQVSAALPACDGSGPWAVWGLNNNTDVNFPTKRAAMDALDGIGRKILTERA